MTTEILVHDRNKLYEIQKLFNKKFAFLQLKFFNLDPTKEKLCSKELMISDRNKTLAELGYYQISAKSALIVIKK